MLTAGINNGKEKSPGPKKAPSNLPFLGFPSTILSASTYLVPGPFTSRHFSASTYLAAGSALAKLPFDYLGQNYSNTFIRLCQEVVLADFLIPVTPMVNDYH
jgi:hypothetical protein